METEIGINTKSEFSSDTMKAQVQEIKYERDKALSSVRSYTTNKSRPVLLEHKDSIEHSANSSYRTREPPELRPINSIHIPKLPLLRSAKSDEEYNS